MYAFDFGDDSKNKTKGISKSYWINNEFDEYKKCLDGENLQEECINYIVRSVNYEKDLQKVKTFSIYFRWWKELFN